jgi:serine/threonine protein kinase
MESYYDCKPLNGDISEYFDIKKFLGAGGYGKVYAAQPTDKAITEIGHDLPDTVAIKIISEDKIKTQLVRNEIQLLKLIDTPNTIKYYGCFEMPKVVYLVMDVASGDNLTRVITTLDDKLDNMYKISIVRELATAIKALHYNGIIHRDLKPDNIMVQLLPEGKVKLTVIDYGLTCYIPENIGKCDGVVGTLRYYDKRSTPGDIESMKLADWWAFGMIWQYLYTNIKPVFGLNIDIKKIPSVYRETFLALTNYRLPQNSRPSPEEILKVLQYNP